MGSIDGATIRDGGRRRCGPVTKSPREVAPMHLEPTPAELCLFAHLTLDAVLFGDYWGWKPLIVGGQLQFRAVVPVGGSNSVSAFDGWSKGGRGVGRDVGTLVKGGVGH